MTLFLFLYRNKRFRVIIIIMQRQNKSVMQPLNPQQIVKAFQVVASPNNSKQLIKQADLYILQCQTNPQFAFTLMQIFSQLGEPQQKWQILIHLNNVIKRNWTAKRNVHGFSMSEEIKNTIKDGLIQLYKISWNKYYKQFNQIFKFLSKYQFPNNYPALKNFILEILRSLANLEIEAFISPEQLLPYLSLVKTIYKGEINKRFNNNLHSEQGYKRHIVQPVDISLVILQKIDNALKILQNMQSIDNQDISNKLLQCSRKIDKIILYCLQYAVSTMQNDRKIVQIIEYFVINKIPLLLGLRMKHKVLNQQIQKNILALVEGTSKLQTNLPFILTDFLQKYFETILNLLINQKFQNEKLINSIIIANTKPLITFVYYCSQSQFKQSMQFKKGVSSNFMAQRQKCHQQFMNIYGGSNAIGFMEKAIMQLMVKYKRENYDQEILFEDSDHVESASQYVSYQLLLNLLKNLMLRFKQQFKPFIAQILLHLTENNANSTSSHVVLNMYEVIFLLPKVYDQPNINIDKILQLMQNCYNVNDFTIFCKLIRCFNTYFNSTAVLKSFQILADIMVKSTVNHQVMYQCAVCIKKILSEHEEEGLPLQKLGPCLSNLLNLMSIYKNNPIYLWDLLQLITELLKTMSNLVILTNLQCIIENLTNLTNSKDNDQTTINAISDLLQNILLQVSPEIQVQNGFLLLEYLYEICINLIGINLCNKKMESPSSLYKLWIAVARNIQASRCSKPLVQKMVNALYNLKQNIIEQDPTLFVELNQQYMLGGLIMLAPDDILKIKQSALQKTSIQQKYRTLMSIFSLYFSFYLTYNTFIPKMLEQAMRTVKQLQDKISQTTNIVRTFIMLVINHHIINLGPQKIFEFFNGSFSNDYKLWFWPYVWSLEYLNHKYACKVASIAMLSSIDVLSAAGILLPAIEGHVPFQKIMKAASFQVQPVTLQNATTSYINAFKMMLYSDQKSQRHKIGYQNNKTIPRKYLLHIKAQWSQCDLSSLFCQKFSPIITNLGWNLQTIEQKFDRLSSSKIISILADTTQNKKN